MIYDVAVIGGGVVGGLVARELTKYALSVAIIEKCDDVGMGASKANSAIVHGGFDPVPGTLKAKLNARGTAMMEALCEELEVHYKNNGSLVVAFDDEQSEHVKKLYARGIENGIPGLSVISGDEARKLEPALSENVKSALLCTSSGIVCPYDLTIASVGNAMDNGADLYCNFAVTSVKDAGDRYEISNGKSVISARYVVNSAGLYSDVIAGMFGDKYEIVAKKGEYMLFDRSEGTLVSRTIFQTPTKAGRGILVTPTVDGNLLIGPTSELCEKDDKATTLEGLDITKATALKSTEKLNFRKIITSFAGLRSALASGDDFVIEMSKNSPRVLELVGIDSPGLSSSPAIAEYAVEVLGKAGLALNPNAKFNGKRVSCRHFEKLTADEKNKVIKENPAYGHLICRCETITEGEIVTAIRQNPPARSLDAVKRRTRSGMGRCQGGFCTPFITELLSKELGINETEVTKFGGGSNLLFGKTK
ncbi:MAG: NAD(P)/FAD-dependent oxidoreductase [Clostridiales bacterium]|nr:NAD(P)/FAD-dependent oxidoreductase [Clostridiales bacterium]